MTEHKRHWIEYMLHVIRPAKGLEQSCRDMLSAQYDDAFNEGKKAETSA